MLVGVEQVLSGTKRPGFRRIIVCSCDICACRLERRFSEPLLQSLEKGRPILCKRCVPIAQLKGGIIEERCRALHHERHGFDYPNQRDDVKAKRQRTNMARYGVKETLAASVVRAKIEQTNIERYGARSSLENVNVREKGEVTKLKRYGNSQYTNTEKMRTTLSEKYGVTNPINVPGAQEKVKATCLERYGVDNPGKSTQIMSVVDWSAVSAKTLATMKAHGSCRTSKPEVRLFQLLCSQFPDTVAQHDMNGWPIDIFIPERQTHIQVDGVYWHGLDRPKHVIEEQKTKRDVQILHKMSIDERQNAWFRERELKLIRITDITVNSLDDDALFKHIVELIEEA